MEGEIGSSCESNKGKGESGVVGLIDLDTDGWILNLALLPLLILGVEPTPNLLHHSTTPPDSRIPDLNID